MTFTHRIRMAFILHIVLAILTLSPLSVTALWPLPQTFTAGTITLILDENTFEFTISSGANAFLQNAIKRYRTQIFSTDFTWPLNTTNTFLHCHSPTLTTNIFPHCHSPTLTTITIHVSHPLDTLTDAVDESYTLDIPGTTGTIRANTTMGALRALETLQQLIYASHSASYIPGIPIRIADAPFFAHRGLLLDTSRNFFPVRDILRTMDAMAASKFNVFHWHAVDAQAWPLEVEGMPQLKKAAYGPSMIYSKEDMRKVVEYGNDRGIRVILEIDMPGHTYALASVFPEIATCMDIQPNWGKFAAGPPSGQLNPLSPTTYTVLNQILTTLLPTFPSLHFHTGGDEIVLSCWSDDVGMQRLLHGLNMSTATLLQEFVDKVHAMVRGAGKVPLVWEEVVLVHDVQVGKDTVVQVWRSADNVARVVKEKGLRVVTGSGDYWYLDCGHGQWLVGAVGNSWCDPFKTWQRIYSFNPIENLSDDEAKLIIGGEILLWAEQTDPMNLDAMLWPRAAAAAEVLWSGPAVARGSDRESVAARLNELRFRLVAGGVRAEPLVPLWCVMNPGHCRPSTN